MKKNTMIKLSIYIIISVLITLVLYLLTMIVINNIPNIMKIFIKNKYFINYVQEIVNSSRIYPLSFIVCSGIMNLILLVLFKNKKLIFYMVIILVNLLMLMAIILFTSVDNQYVFQLLRELENAKPVF